MCCCRLIARQREKLLGLFSRLMILNVSGDSTFLGVVVVEYSCFGGSVASY